MLNTLNYDLPASGAKNELLEVRLALRASVSALLREAKLASDEQRGGMLEAVAIKRALFAEAVDELMRELGIPYDDSAGTAERINGELSATAAERELLHASTKLKRRGGDDRIRSLATDIQTAAGGLAVASLDRSACI